MQSLQPRPGGSYRGIYEALTRMMKQEGVFRPVRGMSVVVVGAGPAHALYFACYEKLKVVFISKVPPQYSHYNHFAYGN
jgi:solute carrier family 25 iron transporter 28/37